MTRVEPSVAQWLDHVGAEALFTAITLFALVNGLFVAGIIVRRDRRELVNRWTSRVLAVDLALIGVGVGVPVVSATTRLAAQMLLPEVRATMPTPSARDVSPKGLVKVPLRP